MLYRSGRQAEALEAFARTRTVLAKELGVAPGPEMQQLHQRVLAGDPGLAAHGAGPAAVPVPRQFPPGSAQPVRSPGRF